MNARQFLVVRFVEAVVTVIDIVFTITIVFMVVLGVALATVGRGVVRLFGAAP